MTRVILCLLVAVVAVGCDQRLGLGEGKPATYTAPLNIPLNTPIDVDVRYVFTRTIDDADKKCEEMGAPSKRGQLMYHPGCATPPWTPVVNWSPRWVVIAVAPVDWNDHKSLSLLGHEVAHTLGGTHERL